jgi:hypothetical protein
MNKSNGLVDIPCEEFRNEPARILRKLMKVVRLDVRY